MPASPDRTPGLSRRTLLRRVAATGLLAAPAVGLLVSCGGSDATPRSGPLDHADTQPDRGCQAATREG